MNSISSAVNVAIDIDLTRCGGVRPRLYGKREKEKINEMFFNGFSLFCTRSGMESMNGQTRGRIENVFVWRK